MNKSGEWKNYTGTQQEWDKLVNSNGGNYRQLYLWGELQKNMGWEVTRLIGQFNNETFLTQLLAKKKFFFYVFYIPGGVTSSHFGYGPILKFIKLIAKNKIYYIKIDSNYKFDAMGKRLFQLNDWSRPLYSINAAKIILVKLGDNTNFIAKASRRFRRQLTKSKQKNIINLTKNTNANDIDAASTQMQIHKNVYLRDDPRNIIKSIDLFGKSLTTISAYDESNNMLGFRSALTMGERAWDFYAATTPLGRNKDVGYPLMHELLKALQEDGCEALILPLSKTNIGDTQFKKRLNGEEQELMGEWEYSNSSIFRYSMNLVIYLTLNSKLLAFFRKKTN
jgi:hypothetical protein